MYMISLLSFAKKAPQLGGLVGSSGFFRHIVCLLVVTLMASTSAVAADSADEHASHHPAEAGGAMPTPFLTESGQTSASGMSGGIPGGTPAPAGGMMAQMGDMMKGMGTTNKKEIYPSLMDLPELTAEKRLEVSQQAKQRMLVGTKMMGQALDALLQAEESENFAAMHHAMNSLREGTAQLESGIAARRALAEGRVPREVALAWFKREMNLSFVVSPEADGFLGSPIFHYLVIAVLGLFAAAMIAMYYVKMKRAHALLARLTGSDETVEGTKNSESTPPGALSPAFSKLGDTKPSDAKPAAPGSTPSSGPANEKTIPSNGWKGILRVNRIFQETPGIKTYRLTAQDGGPIPFTYLPGQYLIIAPMLEGRRTPRSYTMASSPTQRHYCELTIKREADGHGVSRYAHDGLQEGELLEVSGPIGHFTFTGAEAKHVVLIGGGVGITPLMSYIRFLTDSGWPGHIYLLYTCRHVSDYIFRSELEALGVRHPQLHLVVTITRPNDEPWTGLTGRLTKEVITQAVPDIATRLIYICGPDAMMRSAQAALLELGVPAAQVKTEAFSAPQGDRAGGPAPTDLLSTPAVLPARPIAKTVPHEENADSKQGDTTSPPPASAPSAARAAEGSTVTFQKSGKPAPLPATVSILEAAESVGVAIDFECRMGTCGRCKVQLLSGAVTMEVEDALSSSEKSDKVILACQAKSTGNCTVNA